MLMDFLSGGGWIGVKFFPGEQYRGLDFGAWGGSHRGWEKSGGVWGQLRGEGESLTFVIAHSQRTMNICGSE